MGKTDVLIGELGVLARAAIVGAVFYLAWTLVSGGSFDAATYAKVVGALFLLVNAVFAYGKWRDGALLSTAEAVQDELR